MVRSTWSSIALGALAAVLSMQSFAVADSSMGGSTQTGFMRDLGWPNSIRNAQTDACRYPEPNWANYTLGFPESRAIPEAGNTKPEDMDAPLCAWRTGSCKTDMSWIASSVGIDASIFDDPVVNYVMRFYIWGACYRSTQYSYNSAAQFCATWWLDPVSDLKVNTTLVCYDMEWTDTNGDIEKVGCAHKAPGAVIPDEGGMASPNATWALIDTPSDFIPDTTFNTAGLERWENRATWYDCNSFTDEGPSRERCKQEATGIVLGNDIPTLQALAKIHKTEGTSCTKNFEDSYAEKGDSTDRDWCESITSAEMIENILPALGFVGTPEEPKALKPVVTPPPPPPPASPPAPPTPSPPPPVITSSPTTTIDPFFSPNTVPLTPGGTTPAAAHPSQHGLLLVLLATAFLGLLL